MSAMAETTSALASVVTSPSLRSSEMSFNRRRMILPDRVFGRSSVRTMLAGRAIGLIFSDTQLRSSFTSASSPVTPERRVTKAAMAWPVSSSALPTTAASATVGWATSADSISVVERRWPEMFITSSTRPSSQK